MNFSISCYRFDWQEVVFALKKGWYSLYNLENNYHLDNVLPHFFNARRYSFRNHKLAHDEYRSTVEAAQNFDDDDFKEWSDKIISTAFSVLNNLSVQHHWSGLLEIERRDSQLLQSQEIIFVNTSADAYKSPNIPQKRQRTSTPAPLIIPNKISSNMETAFTAFINKNIGNKIIQYTTSLSLSNQKERYFKSVGLNCILDTTDNSTNSQLSNLNEADLFDIEELFKQEVPAKIYDTHTQQLITMQQKISPAKSDKHFLKKILEQVETFSTNENHLINKRLCTHALETYTHNIHMFGDEESKLVSEADYVVKIWGRVQ